MLTISDLHRTYWDSGLDLAFQQMGSLLLPYVTEGSQMEVTDTFSRIGTTTVREKTGRNEKVEYSDTSYDQRTITSRKYYWAHLLDKQDQVEALKDPTNELFMNAVMAMGRKVDEKIIEAALGNARTGLGGETVTPLPATQKIAVNYDPTTPAVSNITLDKLQKVRSIWGKAQIAHRMMQATFVCPQEVVDAFYRIDKLESDLYVNKGIVSSGMLPPINGFNIIQSELVPKDSNGYYRCFAFLQPGVRWNNYASEERSIDLLPEYHNSAQLYIAKQGGATRMWEEMVVEVLCDPTK